MQQLTEEEIAHIDTAFKVRQEKEARQAEVSARMDAEEREKRAKEERAEKEKRRLQDNIANLLLQAKQKELAELKDKAILVYQKYVNELESNINRLDKAELITLLKYICKIENKDGHSKHSTNKMRKERLGKCTPSWTSYFT